MLGINSTSLPAHFEELVACPGDIVGLQEARICPVKQQLWEGRLKEKGWDVVWGKGVPTKRGRPVPGGVCILARRHIRLQAVPMDRDEGPGLFESGRVVHAAAALGDGTSILHVFSFYGHPNAGHDPQARTKNEALLQQLLSYIARLGNVPVLILGDFNVEIERSAILTSSEQAGKLWDVLPTLGADEPTCFAHDTSQGTRIDMILASPSVMACCRGACVMRECGYPTHRPVVVNLNVDTHNQVGDKFKVPEEIPPHAPNYCPATHRG